MNSLARSKQSSPADYSQLMSDNPRIRNLTLSYDMTGGDHGRVRRDECPTDRRPVLCGLPGPAGEQCRVHANTFVYDGIQMWEPGEGLQVGHVNAGQLLVDLFDMLGVFRHLAKDSD